MMQPNIFLILLDSLRIDHVYGNEKSFSVLIERFKQKINDYEKN